VAAMIEYVVVASAEPAALAAYGHHDSKCVENFDVDQALRKTGYRDQITLWRTNDWTDKFITAYGTRDMIFCDGRYATYSPGFHDHESNVGYAWLHCVQDKTESGCRVYDYPNNEYIYCDGEAGGILACDGPLLNATFFSDMGARGQDCDSWWWLTEYLSETATLDDIARACVTRAMEQPTMKVRKRSSIH